jgi:hypothetical protein
MTDMGVRHGDENFDEAFNAYISAGELRVPQSVDGRVMGFTARNSVDGWQTDVEWVPASGKASLYSFVIYHQQYDPERPTPYNIAFVELEEGPRLISAVICDDLASLRVGMSLQASFDEDGQLVFLPVD